MFNNNNKTTQITMMRTHCKLALAGAIALASLFSCNKVNEEINPNYNSKTDEVTTQFVFNIATGNTPTTRQSGANTQATVTETFRGMEDAALIAYKLNANGSHVASDADPADKVFNLDRILNTGEIDQNKSRRIVELSVPTGTNTFMFYAKAFKDGTDAQQGRITFTVDQDPKNTGFKLSSRLLADKENAYEKEKELLSFILTHMIKSKLSTTSPVVFNGESDNSGYSWKWYGDQKKAGNSLSPLGDIMADTFYGLTTINAGEVRAGSGPAVSRTIGDLWTVISNVNGAIPTSLDEAIAKAVASEVTSRLSLFFTEKGPNCQFRPMANIIPNTEGLPNAPTGLDLINTDNLNEFPMNYNLPQGVAQITYTDNTEPGADPMDVSAIAFSYQATDVITGLGSDSDPKRVFYPAELTYFGNSAIRVSNEEHVTNDYPQGVANWDNNANWSADWTINGAVVSTTKSVAMKDNINYGTALLKTTVSYGADVLNDNREALTGEENNAIPVTADAFTFQGIMIGGQNAYMGWDFTRKYQSTAEANAAGVPGAEKFDGIIFDSQIPNVAIPTTGSSEPNYTLVFDNWDSSLGASQSDVVVALEFVNNSGQDFWGLHNLVRNGATFYLLGRLSCANAVGDIVWPTNYALPPYNASGATIQEKRIFIQDYMTTANFSIGANSLQKAYMTVPDLRASHVSVGLSVDIAWSTGLTFNTVLGGN